MSTTWERFAGREDLFGLRMTFRDDPDHASADPEVSASWGSFQLWAGGKNLCAHADQGETLESVHWYLLPLLEWLASNWDPLLHEERLPVAVEGATAVDSLRATAAPSEALPDTTAADQEDEWYEWWQRHAWRAARDGGPFPDLVLRRWRGQVELSWGESPLAGGEGLTFMASSGSSRLDPVTLAAPLLEVLTEAADFLVSALPASERLAALHAAVADLRAPERVGARMAWMAGLRNVGFSVRESWERVENVLAEGSAGARAAALDLAQEAGVVRGSCQAALLFGAVAPDVSEGDVEQLARLLLEQYAPGTETQQLLTVSEARPVPADVPPWQDGLDLANQLRDDLGLSAERPPDVRVVLDRLGIDLVRRDLDDSAIRGVALASDDHRPTILVNGASVFGDSNEAERFTIAHELCHFLVDRGIEGRRLAVASGPWAPREVEQRANAFAAYFLMPPQGLWLETLRMDTSARTMAGAEHLATFFGVSVHAMIEHLPNIGLVTHADRTRLLRERFRY